MKELNFKNPYTLKYASSITEFNSSQWNNMVPHDAIPFLEWEWLAALETSGSICPKTGWRPLYLSLWDKYRLLAVSPLYIKYHSDGEFVWDYFFAEAAASVGRPWYPKLVGTVPATPAEGYRFLFAPEEDPRPLNKILLDAAEHLCRRSGIRGLHLLFTDPFWAAWPGSLMDRSYGGWKHSRFVWENRYTDFDQYLAQFNKNQRKNIRKEYGRHKDQGITLRILEGQDADHGFFDRIFELYSLTNDKFLPWDARWVNRDFFRLCGKMYRGRTVFSEARRLGARGEETLAMAMMFRKEDHIWGRYWGAYEDVKDLHFALCYYAPMDYCIRKGIRYFDPGVGSPHKIRRGFRAAFDLSYHKFFDPVLESIFTAHMAAANQYEEENIAALNAAIPVKIPAPWRAYP
ncbi:MAG: GNAT family N-acetyltransferase [Spirochaetaceae bacterium]|jgi:predicted N-acyltransferase|nr:GNAT family N-acetyltransferase [Spirochaetaceae bacterium]